MTPPEHPTPSGAGWLFFTDTPPLRGPAPGSHGLACHFLDTCGGLFQTVLTRQTRRYVVPDAVKAQFPVPVLFFADATLLGIRRFLPGVADLLDVLLGWGSLLWLRPRLGNPERTFALLGANGWSLMLVAVLRVLTGVPLDLYLVDDLEESARIQNRVLLQRILPWLEKRVLLSAARVFVISPGYAEHLRAKYGIHARWLPAPMHLEGVRHRPFQEQADGVRTVVFVGGVSQLYLSALVDLLEEIVVWNKRHPDRPLRLEILSYGFPSALAARREFSDVLGMHVALEPGEFAGRCRNAWAFFLPYAFDPEVRTLVKTSFSWKLSDAYRAGRPILVYGPAEASLPRYFRELGLPLCATSRPALRAQIAEVDALDLPALGERYHACWERFHSANAVRRHLRDWECVPETAI